MSGDGRRDGRRHRGVAAPPEHEIVDELSEEIEDNGETRAVANEETVKREGALNAEAVQSNRRRKSIENKKRGGAGTVPWNESRAPLLYDDIIALYPPNTLMIYVERLSGTLASWYLYGQPKSGHELYQAILKQCHGRKEETEYRVVFRDAQRKFERGIGRLTLPSTLDDATLPVQPQGMGMPNGVPPANYGQQNGYGQPNGYPPQQPPQNNGYPQQQQPPPQNYPQQAPQFAQQPMQPMQPQYAGHSPQETQVLLDMQRQIAEMSGRVTAYLTQQPMQTPPQQDQHRPIYDRPSPRYNGSVVPPAPQPPPQQAMQPPPGMYHVPGFGFVPTAKLMEAMGVVGPQQQQAPAAPPQPPRNAADEFRSAIGLMTTVADAARTVQSIFPSAASAPAAPAAREDDDLPMKTIKYGDFNTVVNKEDGSLRIPDTIAANGEKILGWIEKQRKDIQAQRQQPQSIPEQPPQNGMMPMPQYPGEQQR